MAKSKTKSKRGGSRGDDGDVALYWKQPKPAVHTFTRCIAGNTIVKNPVDSGYAVAFTLADLPGSTEFANLFDQYKINWVDYIFQFKSANLTQYGVTLYYAEDHDDASAPTLNAIMEAQSTQIVTFGTNRTMVKFRVKPNPLRAVYRSALTTGYERAPNGTWLDCAQSDIPHYGVKYFIQNYNSAPGNDHLISVILRYNVSFKETI